MTTIAPATGITPMCITAADADYALRVLDEALTRVEA